MKILGVSFGRVMKNCEITLKTALIAAEKSGAEVQFMRLLPSDIKACLGCGCKKVDGRVVCRVKDDFQAFEEAYMDADAVIFAAPVYALGPTGTMKNLADRMGPGRDMAALMQYQEDCKTTGNTPLDERYFRQRYCALISVGGAMTHNWVSFGLAGMHINAFSTQMRVIDQLDIYDSGRRANPLFDDQLIKRLEKMGEHVAKSLGKPVEEVEYIGEEGTCPVCHLNLLTVNGTTTVECPVCGIEGKISIDSEKLKVSFSEEQQLRSRHRIAGLIEHFHEIESMKEVAIPKIQAHEHEIEPTLQRYREFDKDHLIKLR